MSREKGAHALQCTVHVLVSHTKKRCYSNRAGTDEVACCECLIQDGYISTREQHF